MNSLLATHRRRRIIAGCGATALGPVVTTIIQLGTVPVLLHAWGAAKYGDWLLLSAIPSYLSLTNLGFGDASGSDMTMRVAADDRKGALETFQTSWALLLFASAALLLFVSSTVWWFPWQRWMRLSTVSSHQASLVILAFATYIIVGQQTGILESGYRCEGNFALGTLSLNLMRLSETVLACSTGVVTGSLLDAALTYLCARVCTTVGYAILLHRKSPWLKLGFKNANLGAARRLAKPASGFMALPIGSALSMQGFVILIGNQLGPVAVTAFSTLRTLTRMNLQLVNAMGWALWPELSSAFGSQDIGLARRLHRRAAQGGLLLSLSTCSFLWFAGPYIYHLWIRSAVPFHETCFHILLIVTLVNSLWFTSFVVPMSANTHHRLAFGFAAASCVSLAVGWLLMPALGIVGAACALLLTDTWMVTVVLRASIRQLEDNCSKFFGALATVPSFHFLLKSR